MMNRRSFLKKIGLLLGSIPFLGFLKEEENVITGDTNTVLGAQRALNSMIKTWPIQEKDWRSIYGKHGKCLIS